MGDRMSNNGKIETIFDISKNKIIPIKLECENLPSYNPANTVKELKVYTGLGKLVGKTGKTYLVAIKWQYNTNAPIGSIVRFYYHTGSRKHISNKYYQFFFVKEGVNKKIVLKDLRGKDDVNCKTVNLEPINELDDSTYREIETEILNQGLTPSDFDPVRTLYYYWKKHMVTIMPMSDVDKQIEELKRIINEKEKEIEELKKKLEELIKQKEIPGRIASL
jgi:hypothetical protein